MSDLDKEELEATRNIGKTANELSEEEIIQHFEFIKSGIKEETKFIDISILECFEGLLDLYKEKNKQIQVEIEGRKILVNLNENLKEELNKEKEKNIPLIIDGKSINAYADEIEDLLSIEDGMPVYFSIGERRAIKIISQYCRNSIPKDKIKEQLIELDNMKVDGEVFTTAVNFAKKILQELLEEE